MIRKNLLEMYPGAALYGLSFNIMLMLDSILAGLNVWFRNAVSKEAFYYPNKYLGDLVCKWLLTEILGKSAEDEMVPVRMRQAADYRKKHSSGTL